MNTFNLRVMQLVGNRKAHRENMLVTVAMLVVTVLYEVFSSHFVPGFTFNEYEFVGTWSGLITVWLSRTRNILCWPWGIVSAAALGFFFAEIALPGQQWLNWGYFLVIQLWAWPHWAFGGENKAELPVSSLGAFGRIATIVSITLGTVVCYFLIDRIAPGSLHPSLDALVVAASIVAQFLLGRKKIESWFLWLGPVNAVSIVLFYTAGAYTVMALYIAFFVHALFALKEWKTAEIIR